MEVKPGVLRVFNDLGTEALVFRVEFIDTVIEQLTHSRDNVYGHCDWQLVPIQKRFGCYSPLGYIAGQQDGYSLLFEKERKVGFRNDFMYEDMDRKIHLYGNLHNNCEKCRNNCRLL